MSFSGNMYGYASHPAYSRPNYLYQDVKAAQPARFKTLAQVAAPKMTPNEAHLKAWIKMQESKARLQPKSPSTLGGLPKYIPLEWNLGK